MNSNLTCNTMYTECYKGACAHTLVIFFFESFAKKLLVCHKIKKEREGKSGANLNIN